MKKIALFIFIFVLIACENDDYILLDNETNQNQPFSSKTTSQPTELDTKILTKLDSASNGVGVSFFILPDSDDYGNIPQDPLNPITADKVALGKLLFHETGTGRNPYHSFQSIPVFLRFLSSCRSWIWRWYQTRYWRRRCWIWHKRRR